MDAAAVGGLDGAGGGLDVFAAGAGEGGDAGAADFAGDGADGFEVAGGSDGEAGLEEVDAEGGELVGHAEFFGVVHGAAGALLAVAQGGIEEEDAIAGCVLRARGCPCLGGGFWCAHASLRSIATKHNAVL